MQESLKTIKLISELAAFVFKAGGKEFNVDFKEKNGTITITIKSHLDYLSVSDLEKLRALDTPRQSQVEEYYWELAGENDQYQELSLVGMMIDEAEFSYKNKLLTISVSRHK